MLFYATTFDKHYNPHYKYSINRRILGTIPAGINTPYRNYNLDTIKLMQQIQHLYNTNQLPKDILSSYEDWYDKNNNLNKHQLYKLHRNIDKLYHKNV